MRKGAKRILSAAMAAAMAVSICTISGSGKAKKVMAAAPTKRDSASETNYATILGGATDYGIVSNSLTQQGHMETTFATNLYVNEGPRAANNDVDYQSKTAHFIIGDISDDTHIIFGKTTASSFYIEAPASVFEGFDQSTIKQDGPHGNFVFAESFGKMVDGQYVYPSITEVVNQNASVNVDRLKQRGADWSERISNKVSEENSPYVLEDSYLDERTGKLVIDINSADFENKVVYIKADDKVLKYLADSSGIIIKKKSSTVVVFDIEDDVVNAMYNDDPLKTNKYEVIVDGVRHVSTTNPKGNPAGGYDDNDQNVTYKEIDNEICQKIIWNFNTDNKVQLNTFAGTMLVPKADVEFTGGNISGWLVCGKDVNTNGIEFHYVYQGGSTDSYGQMHFSLRKAFTENYANKDEVIPDNTVDIEAASYKFLWQEYKDCEHKEKYGEEKEALVRTDSLVMLPQLSFYTGSENVNDYHYVPKGSADDYDETHDITEVNPETNEETVIDTLYYKTKHFYYEVKEDQDTVVPGVINSKGKIDIDLKVRVDQYGNYTYAINSLTTTGDNGEIEYDKNVDTEMSGVQFDLGAFYNKSDFSSLKLKKVFKLSGKESEVNLTDEQKEKIIFTITGDGYSKEVNYKQFVDGEYVITNIAPGNYTVTESGQDTEFLIKGYKFDEDNSEVVKNDVVVTDDKTEETIITNAYIPDESEVGNIELKKIAKRDNVNYNREFYIGIVDDFDNTKDPLWLNVDGTMSTTENFITVTANKDVITIPNVVPGRYHVYELRNEDDEEYSSVKHWINGKEIDPNNIFDDRILLGEVNVEKADLSLVHVTNEYTSYKGRITINKKFVDEDGKEIYNPNFNYSDINYVIVNNKDGKETVVNFRPNVTLYDQIIGVYSVEEQVKEGSRISTQDGKIYEYVSNEIVPDKDELKKDDVITFNVTNKYKKLEPVTINIKKVDKDGDLIDGADFELYMEGSKERIRQSSYQSSITWNDLYPGNYTIVESKAPTNVWVNKYGRNASFEPLNKPIPFTIKDDRTVVAGQLPMGVTFDENNNLFEIINEEDTGASEVTFSKIDEKNNPVAGAEFTLTKASGSFDTENIKIDAKKYSVTDTAITWLSEENDIVIKGLDDDTYTLSETIWPEGYVQSQPIKFSIVNGAVVDGYKNSNDAATAIVTAGENGKITMINKEVEKKYGSLKITKSVSGNNVPENTPSFGITVTFDEDISFTVNGVAKSGRSYSTALANGESVTINDIPEKVSYKVEEVQDFTEDGYKEYKKSKNNIVYSDANAKIDGDDSDTVTVNNDYEQLVGTLTVTKLFDGITTSEIPAAFKITNSYNQAIFIPSNAKSGDGINNPFTWELANVPVGTTVKFTESGYEKDGYKVTINEQKATAANAVSPEVTVKENGNDVTAFVNKYEKKVGYIDLVKTIEGPVTDEDIEGLSFKVTDGKDFEKTLTLKDDFNDVNGDKTLFQLKEKIEVPASDEGIAYTVIETLQTSEGKVVEVSYVLDGNDNSSVEGQEAAVTVKTNDDREVKFNNKYEKVESDKIGYINITKTIEGPVTEEDYKGLTFVVKDADGKTVGTYVLGKDFKVIDEANKKFELKTPIEVKLSEEGKGTFTVEETLYKIDGTTVNVTYTVNGGNEQDGTKASVEVTENNTSEVSYKNDYEEEVVVTKKGYINITKTIEGPVTEEDYKGLTFVVKDADGKTVGTYVLGKDFKVIDEANKKFELKTPIEVDLSEVGKATFTVEETLYKIDGTTVNVTYTVNGGNEQNGTKASVEVTENNTSEVSYKNDYKNEESLGNLLITVIEEKTGKRVPGAVVEVKSQDGKVIKTLETNEDGQILLKDIPAGGYKVTVKTVPDGYNVTTGREDFVTVVAGSTEEFEAILVTPTDAVTTDDASTAVDDATTTENTATESVVKTNDPTNTMPFIITMIASLAGIVFVAGRKRKLNK